MTPPLQIPLLQILICSVWARTGELVQLLAHLTPQIDQHCGAVQVLVDRDDCQAPVGVKRTRLLEAATASYVCFVDDDDWVSYDYADRIMLALAERPDAVGFNLAYSHNGRMDKLAIHSRKHTIWSEDGLAYYRTINHLNPVRRAIAMLGAPFKDGFGEDRVYADTIAPFIETEVFLDGDPAYEYRYSSARSLFTGGRRQVGVDPLKSTWSDVSRWMSPHVRFVDQEAVGAC